MTKKTTELRDLAVPAGVRASIIDFDETHPGWRPVSLFEASMIEEWAGVGSVVWLVGHSTLPLRQFWASPENAEAARTLRQLVEEEEKK